MKMFQKNVLLGFVLFSLILMSATCDSAKEVIAKEGCDTEGTIKDFTGLDGCQLMVVLDNGDKLLPADITDESFNMDDFKDEQAIRFGYKEVGGASICMAEKAIVEITCIELR